MLKIDKKKKYEWKIVKTKKLLNFIFQSLYNFLHRNSLAFSKMLYITHCA